MAEPKRRKPGRPRRVGPARETVVALKGSPEWKAWLDGFADHCRLGLADTIEQSLDYYAQERRYPPTAEAVRTGTACSERHRHGRGSPRSVGAFPRLEQGAS